MEKSRTLKTETLLDEKIRERQDSPNSADYWQIVEICEKWLSWECYIWKMIDMGMLHLVNG